MKSLMFVCLGNICRSPIAHTVMEDIISKAGTTNKYNVDSSGTGAWHVGEGADPRMRETARENGLSITHLAQKLVLKHLENFDTIFAMDQSNKSNIHLLDKANKYSSKIFLFRDFDPEATSPSDVPDPYYGGNDGFKQVYSIVARTCSNIYKLLEAGKL